MASKSDDNRLPRGVRGPGGPPPAPQPGATRPGTTRAANGTALHRVSPPLLRRLHALPRWLVVITPAIVLFAGLILTGPFAWLGALLLALVGVFLGWLTALSWPAIGPAARLLRVVVVVALFGIAVYKAMGKF